MGKGTQDTAMTTLSKLQTVGLDVGDKFSTYCVLDLEGQVVGEGVVRTREAEMGAWFRDRGRCRVALEVGQHSPWINELLRKQGHEVCVANASNLAMIAKSVKKTDRRDAEVLARFARIDTTLLGPIEHRGMEEQRDLTVVRNRAGLVECRTKLINQLRGSAKGLGPRLPKCDADVFHERVAEDVRLLLPAALQGLLRVIGCMTEELKKLDEELEEMVQRYPATQGPRAIRGVGPVISMAFVLTIGDPARFAASRDVGPYLGLTPKRRQSGDRDPQLRISKAGDKLMRRLLVQGAHYILGPFGQDCDLRRWGLGKLAGASKNAKKRVYVAVARKLAVLMHYLWVTGKEYDPLYLAKKRGEVAPGGEEKETEQAREAVPATG